MWIIHHLPFCAHCGKEVSPQAIFCPVCGHSLKQAQTVTKPIESVSGWWWLLPFFLVFIGGLIAYFVLKDRNEKTATNMLIFGVVWTLIGPIVLIALAGFLFGFFGSFT
jgi:uncharacterized membrane protein YeaQ/YmgE (transglycosylase-associated protein family)